MTPDWIRSAIADGVTVDDARVVLQAERVTVNGRPLYRVHLDHFVTFLKAIGWHRLPRRRPPDRPDRAV